MAAGSELLWELSIALLVFILLFQWLRGRIGGSYALALLLSGAIVISLIFFTLVYRDSGYGNVTTKGGTDRAAWIMIGVMYLAMVLGIVAQSFYFGEPTSPSTSWIKPTLASPIIFIPLLSSYQSSLANTTGLEISDVMIMLVSFQNGFFWKVVFDKQAEALRKDKA